MNYIKFLISMKTQQEKIFYNQSTKDEIAVILFWEHIA